MSAGGGGGAEVPALCGLRCTGGLLWLDDDDGGGGVGDMGDVADRDIDDDGDDDDYSPAYRAAVKAKCLATTRALVRLAEDANVGAQLTRLDLGGVAINFGDDGVRALASRRGSPPLSQLRSLSAAVLCAFPDMRPLAAMFSEQLRRLSLNLEWPYVDISFHRLDLDLAPLAALTSLMSLQLKLPWHALAVKLLAPLLPPPPVEGEGGGGGGE